jgi:sulfate transporter 1, high-affinity
MTCVFVCGQLILSNPGSIVIEKLHASKLTEHIGINHIFLAVADAVRFCSTKTMQEP